MAKGEEINERARQRQERGEKQVSVWIRGELKDYLDHLAKSANVSQKAVLEEAIEEHRRRRATESSAQT